MLGKVYRQLIKNFHVKILNLATYKNQAYVM
ncbi:hypothetical protein EDD79_10488 [Serpentinicella alkaliphila]|uniref:Uncharacterized protein n=1 Tax=Serpentinicella alkaliphila TaxID=1734049 RepID=A0A4R2T228_9FIRM|nr:hypothetical protein EDD79_10488 [Serpentinicella alkaliphila]